MISDRSRWTRRFRDNNLEQQLLLLTLTVYWGHLGVNNNPFRASQVVRGKPECSRVYAFNNSSLRTCEKVAGFGGCFRHPGRFNVAGEPRADFRNSWHPLLQLAPFSGPFSSPATTLLWPLHFSSHYTSLTITLLPC